MRRRSLPGAQAVRDAGCRRVDRSHGADRSAAAAMAAGRRCGRIISNGGQSLANTWQERCAMGRIEGKICIVTGAADGLGKADATVLAREGGRVVITDVNEAAGQPTAEEIGAIFIAQDVRSEDGWRALVERVMDEYGRLDGPVNNAGVIKDRQSVVWGKSG